MAAPTPTTTTRRDYRLRPRCFSSPRSCPMAKRLAGIDKEVLVEVVRFTHKSGLRGCDGGWKDFLARNDRKFGASVSDPRKRSRDVLFAFLQTFPKDFQKIIGITSVSLLPVKEPGRFYVDSYMGISRGINALAAALCMNVYVVGLNKVNKPTLPLASGEFSVPTPVLLVVAFLVMVSGHGLLASTLWQRAQQFDIENKDCITQFYMFIWKLFYAEYFLIPFV
ncbi:Small RNA degrading nuclease 3 [Zea mays]|uniref:Small RNA degrading nuclease 3 n=2 Tax=Zea mays TaxID=4577 RepID=A0A1D6P0B1_MAIZE|nr:Small RNA degrading nuclease 3 [Zea mays]